MAGKITPKFGVKPDKTMRNQQASAKAQYPAKAPGVASGTGSGGPAGAKIGPAFGVVADRTMKSKGGGTGLSSSPAINKPSMARRKAKMC